MNLPQTIRNKRDKLRIVSLSSLKTNATVAVFRRKLCCIQYLFLGECIAANAVIILADAAVTAVNRADIRDFNEAAIVNLISHELGCLLIGGFLKLLAVFRFRQTEEKHDILIV